MSTPTNPNDLPDDDDEEPVRDPYGGLVEDARMGGGGIHIPLYWGTLFYLPVLLILGLLIWWVWFR